MKKVAYEALLPHEMQQRVAQAPVVYVPLGALEYHEEHLPLGLDGIKAYELCQRAAQQTGGVVLPLNYWMWNPPGITPWTLAFTSRTVRAVLRELFEQLALVGFRVIIVVTGHTPGEHLLGLKAVAEEVMRRADVQILALEDYELAMERGYLGDHAGKWETSIMMALQPELVDMGRLDPDLSQPLAHAGPDDPRLWASSELGAQALDWLVIGLVDEVRRVLAGGSVDNWARHRRALMLQRARRYGVYVPGSFRNTGTGFRFAFRNEETALTPHLGRLVSLRVDRQRQRDLERVALSVQGKTMPARDITPAQPLVVLPGQEVEVEVQGRSLVPGLRELRLTWRLLGVEYRGRFHPQREGRGRQPGVRAVFEYQFQVEPCNPLA